MYVLEINSFYLNIIEHADLGSKTYRRRSMFFKEFLQTFLQDTIQGLVNFFLNNVIGNLFRNSIRS